ncbi:ATP-binding protein [Streptomyces sp. NBC_00390]|uniref:AAA family ATPase n=1 Tax=Streptomyces sp. NBC_00390 TaxID=2975736 RepID=UPI002E1AA1C2
MPQSDAVRHPRPDGMFDRAAEWEALVAFACAPEEGPSLGIVSGRRRQGKTYLLKALTRATGGFYFGAQEVTEAESLHQLADQLALHTGASPAPGPHGWVDAVDALLALGDPGPFPVVIDEFPDLVRQSPALPSILHGAFHRLQARSRPGRPRLLLSGSTVPVMHRLFSASSPLRGLATLALAVRPLDFRQAAGLWGIDDSRLALLVHAVVGGAPAYRYEFVSDDTPTDPDDFDRWVCRTVLNPRRPLFWEARHLLDQGADHWDRALCHSVLTAIVSGNSTRGAVTESVACPLPQVSRALGVLQDCGLLQSESDAFRPGLTWYRIAEPFLAFDHAIVWPHRSALEQSDAAQVWQRARSVFDALVVAPDFAQVCRDWAAEFAAPDTFGAPAGTVSHGSIPGPQGSTAFDIEVVVRGASDHQQGALLSVGQAHWNEIMDLDNLRRLRHVLALLADSGEDVGRAMPACYSGAGFSPELRAAEARGEVLLVGLDRLYHGA